MAELTGIVVYSSVLFNRTGDVRRWADRVQWGFTRHAIEEAPDNERWNKSRYWAAYPPGSLRLSIEGDVDRIGPHQLETIISVNVPYATYVLRGTDGAYVPAPDYMYLPKNPGFGTKTRHHFVRGQDANNFLMRAAQRTARTHPSLSGFVADMDYL